MVVEPSGPRPQRHPGISWNATHPEQGRAYPWPIGAALRKVGGREARGVPGQTRRTSDSLRLHPGGEPFWLHASHPAAKCP